MWNFLKLNTILNLAVIMEILPQDLLLCDFLTVLARFKKYWLSLSRYSASKVSNVRFAKIQLKHYTCQLLFLLIDRESNPKCLQW